MLRKCSPDVDKKPSRGQVTTLLSHTPPWAAGLLSSGCPHRLAWSAPKWWNNVCNAFVILNTWQEVQMEPISFSYLFSARCYTLDGYFSHLESAVMKIWSLRQCWMTKPSLYCQYEVRDILDRTKTQHQHLLYVCVQLCFSTYVGSYSPGWDGHRGLAEDHHKGLGLRFRDLKKKGGGGGTDTSHRHVHKPLCVFMLQLLYNFFCLFFNTFLLVSLWVSCLSLLFLCGGGGGAVRAIRTLLRGKTPHQYTTTVLSKILQWSVFLHCSPSPGPGLVCLGGIFGWKRPVRSGAKSPYVINLYMLIRQHPHGPDGFSPSSFAAPHLWTLTCSSRASVGTCWWDTARKWGGLNETFCVAVIY